MVRRYSHIAPLIGALFLMLGGCASAPLASLDSAVQVVPSTELPQPDTASLSVPSRPYVIGPLDKLSVRVFGVEELSLDVQTDAGGRFSYPLIGEVQAAGLQPSDLARQIETRLAGNFVRNPQVTVNLTESVSSLVTVDGQVKQPGRFPVIGNMTLMQAVAVAGGNSEFAKLDDVVVFRTVDGKRYAGLYNLRAIRRGNYADPQIYGNDVVVVGDSQARRLFNSILQATPLLTAPLIILAQN
jgi:polysaccharide export outer membrane protein